MKPLPEPPSARGAGTTEPPSRAALVVSGARTGSESDSGSNPDGEAIAADLGTRVRTLRKQGGLTLNDLSERSGVSRAFISAIERNAKSPTLPIVVRIAKGLNVTMSALLGAEREVADVSLHRREDRVTFRDPDSGFERQVLSPSHAGGDVEIVLHRIPPGGSSGLLPTYATPTQKHIVVQEGTLAVHLDGKAYRARAGDALSFDIDAPYELRNDGDQTCIYIVVMVRKY